MCSDVLCVRDDGSSGFVGDREVVDDISCWLVPKMNCASCSNMFSIMHCPCNVL